jgi:ADP-ribose pyrophosphatase
MLEIPPDARRVFRGAVYDVYQWSVVDAHGRSVTHEALRRPDVAVAIAVQDDTILLAREQQSGLGTFWTHFGGFIEPGEQPIAAAARELAEEAGMTAAEWTLLSRYDHPGRVVSATYIYLARDLTLGPQALQGDERIEVVSVSWAEWLDLIRQPTFRGRAEIQELLYTGLDAERAARLYGLFFGR